MGDALSVPFIVSWLFYIGMPVVPTEGRSVGVRSRNFQIFSDG